MICPNCRSEYRPGFTYCAECGVELIVAPIPEDPPITKKPAFRPEAIGPELIEVYRTWGSPQAELVRSLLEANGIECVLSGGGQDAAYNFTVGAMAEVRILVKPHDVEAARNILRAADHGEFAVEE